MIDRDEFKAWLERKGSSIVGWSNRCTRCPLATYLEETTGKQPYVGAANYEVGEEMYPTPAWATDFIARVDDDKQPSYPILGTTALRILEDIK